MEDPAVRHAARAMFAALFALVAVASPGQAATDEAAAREVTGKLLQESYGAMAGGNVAQVKQAVADAFALEVWERFLLGEQELSEAERETFRGLLPG